MVDRAVIYLNNNSASRLCDKAREWWWQSVHRPINISASDATAVKVLNQVTFFIDTLKKDLKFQGDIIFTSCGSESNNTILYNVLIGTLKNADGISPAIPHIVTSAIEHSSILEWCDHYEGQGRITVTKVNPGSDGRLNPTHISDAIKPDTVLVTIMGANNELGTIQDIAAIRQVVRNIHFHSDATQSFLKDVNFPYDMVDSFTATFHKTHGPKGVALLGTTQVLTPLIFGSQQNGHRGGTVPESLVICAAIADDKYLKDRSSLMPKLVAYDRWLRKKLVKALSAKLLGDQNIKIPGTILFTVPNICNKEWRALLEKEGVIVGIGSACLTNNPNSSHVINAIGLPQQERSGIIRISLSIYTGKNDIYRAYKKIVETGNMLKNTHPPAPPANRRRAW